MSQEQPKMYRLSAAVAATAATSLGLAAAPALAAQSFEQITRTSGPYASATALPSQQPVAVGDVGRFAAFGTQIRDIRNNLTTQPGGAATARIYGMDALETKVLIGRQFADRVELAVTPLTGGGTSKVIRTVRGVSQLHQGFPGAVLSRDGSTVIAFDAVAKQILSIDVATGAVRTLQSLASSFDLDGWYFRAGSVSADGRTVVIGRGPSTPASSATWTPEARVLRDGQLVASVPAATDGLVSADGSRVVLSLPSEFVNGNLTPARLMIRDLTAGTSRLLDVPSSFTPGFWLSPDGTQMTGYASSSGARSLNLETGAFTDVAGPYGWGLVTSPSGRFTIVGAGAQLVLADRTGADLPGADDPLSGDVYIHPGATLRCNLFLGVRFPGTDTGTVGATLLSKPVSWAPAAKSATVTLKLNSTVLKTVTGVQPGQYVEAAFKGTATTYSQVATVTDAAGRVTAGTLTSRFGGCP